MNIQRIRIFDEMLDEWWPEWKFGEQTFYPSQILADCDPVSYEIKAKDYLNQLHEEGALECNNCDKPITEEQAYAVADVFETGGEIQHKQCDTE
jgi:hypothetical protein